MKSITIMDQRYTTYGTDHFLIAPLTDFDGGARAGTAVNDEPPCQGTNWSGGRGCDEA